MDRHERAQKANRARNAALSAEERRLLAMLANRIRWGRCGCGCGADLNPMDPNGRPRRYLNGHNRATMIRKGRSQSRLTADDFLLALGTPPKGP